jgi:hypothetical protein
LQQEGRPAALCGRATASDLYWGTIGAGAHITLDLVLEFFKRILSYKAVDGFADAAEILMKNRIPVKLGVGGTGKIGLSIRWTLSVIGAEVVN